MFARIRTTATALISATASLLVASAAFAGGGGGPVAPHEDISFNVALRGTGSVSVHADVYNNTQHPGAVTILAVHGLAERGSMWSPLASAIFADDVLGSVVKRIVAIDMPAHGLSGVPSLPSPLLFQDLTIEDNASVVIQSIDTLRGLGKAPQIVIGHSMGGLEVQTAQEELLAQSSSYLRHGVVGAILLDAVPANGTQWTQPPPNSGTAQFIFTDPTLGTILGLPAAAGPFTGAFNRISDGALVPNTPSVDTFVANNWVGPEPITTLLELIGTSAPLWRPFVRQNAFQLHNGTVLSVIAGAQDVAPAASTCTAANVDATAEVPYTAEYVFWK